MTAVAQQHSSHWPHPLLMTLLSTAFSQVYLLNIKSVSYLLHKKYAAAVTDGDLVERLELKSKIMMLVEKK